MKLSGHALRLTVIVGLSDQWQHRPVYAEVVRRARKAGLAGATVVQGIEGYGANSRIHTTHLFRLSEDRSMVVVIVDAAEKIRAFLPQLDELSIDGLVMLDEVDVVRYVAR
jgi:PII-like signaling protein